MADSSQLHRLGKQDLGPYAFEDAQPSRIDRLLRGDGQSNDIENFIPKLARLLQHDPGVRRASLCHKDAVQIHKLPRENNTFCGYRNLQMLLLTAGRSGEYPSLRARKTVPDLQIMIEKAWDEGINQHGRVQTGGIIGTRKYIGSSEVEATLLSLGIDCVGTAFDGKDAAQSLLAYVHAYYNTTTHEEQVLVTSKMPVFLQRPRHSVLVVGIATLKNDASVMLICDPAKPPPLNARDGLKSTLLRSLTDKLHLRSYRLTRSNLERYSTFETVAIDVQMNDQVHE